KTWEPGFLTPVSCLLTPEQGAHAPRSPPRHSNESFLPHGHPVHAGRVDGDAEAAPDERRRPPAAARERDVLHRQPLPDEVPVVAALDVAEVGHARREVPAGGREDRGLADLTAELVPESVPLRQLREA